jgi:hypothetical protein
VFNSTTRTQSYGTIQSRNTRYNHIRDDKRKERATGLVGSGSVPAPVQESNPRPAIDAGPPSDSITVQQGGEWTWIKLWEKELLWHRELPLTSPTVPLVFVNSPILHGDYKQSFATDILNPNSGLYALDVRRRANAAFLSTENRLCDLMQILKRIPQSSRTVHLSDQLHEELNRLDYEKELQWIQQRAHFTPGKVVVNTGASSFEISLPYN